ncbi:OpgC domain-containing protein [Devosia sp. PTR5]|uniref:OpgC domain-containing protein n=2 Tax=Devosia oryzisoli TaxID=2774138 RepID=A0A927IR92_9HYPH|nr:OpgC domain-containing protein [Devosia oryzisoli]
MGHVMAGAAPLPPGARDDRLDMFRGLALVMIFINHVPGTVYENFTNRNFGFSDAAEAFVFMSGLAAGLAYSGAFRNGGPLWLAIARPWARARQLYFVHIAITAISLAIFAGAAHYFGLYEVLLKNNIAALVKDPLATLVGIPLLTHQFGYLNILPLYLVLLLASPLVFIAGLRWPWPTFLCSIALWVLAGQFRINLPNYPTSGGWFFNPISWQLLFVTGLLSGMAMKQGRRFIPVNPWLFLLSLGFVLFVIVWVKVPPIAEAGRAGLGQLSAWGLPFYLTNFDKSFVAAPRLLHALALFYVLASIPALQLVAASRWTAPLRSLGRQGLAVFATGTVLSLFLQAIKTVVEPDPVTDGLMLGSGLVLLLVLSWALNTTTRLRRAQPRPAAATTPP